MEFDSGARDNEANDSNSQHRVLENDPYVSIITPMQMKLARTALGFGVRDLAAAAGVAPSTVQRFESERGDMHSRTLDRVQRVLEEAGIVFIDADADGGPGVRLRK